ncbi:splicing factor, arginine/serine-rich 19 [Sarcophilus harrisii]|uniref:splicing factor, arginine/serine-rich 19 n=1 Tax=Sarcophilus harrisii TaxID=9305 RepID=UPI001301D8F0|nr:splicing factor, arginine/serine-rich 19 [Sarcophilus harrisii]
MEEEEEPRGASPDEPHDEAGEVPGLPDGDPGLAASPAPLPSALILRALQQAVGGSLQGELSGEKDVSRARGPRRKRCRSPRAEMCLRGAGGTDAAAVVDLAARSFLAGLLGVLEPPDSWVPGRPDLPAMEEEPAEMLELVAEVHLGDGAPLSLPISHPLHSSRAWRVGKSGSLLQPGLLGPGSPLLVRTRPRPGSLPPNRLPEWAPRPGLCGGQGRPEEGKLSLEVVTTGAPFPPAAPPLDSEIEEGEIVQPEEELRFAPVALFRGAGGRAPRPTPPSAGAASAATTATPAAPLPPPPARGPEGDDFLSLHAESDGEGALQVDLGDPVPAAPPATSSDPRWTGLDLRRKILTQRRERYRQRSPSPAVTPTAPPQPPRKKSKRDLAGAKGRPARSREPRPPWAPRQVRITSPARSSAPPARSSPRPRSSWSRAREGRGQVVPGAAGGPARPLPPSRGPGPNTGNSNRRRKAVPGLGGRGGDPEKVSGAGTERESRRRGAVPPSIQDLTDHDLFSIKRTITVGRAEKPASRSASSAGGPAPASPLPKREVLYDSEGLSCEERGGGGGKGSRGKGRATRPPRGEGASRGGREAGQRAPRPAFLGQKRPKTPSQRGSQASSKWILIREGLSPRPSASPVTALLFKMEEANLASRAKAQELIQATNQILGHAKPPSALGGAQAPGGTVLGLPPGPSGYLLHGGGGMGLPLGGCSSSPPSPGGLAGGPDRREGSSSSDGRMDTDKYLKKLHTQERAVEEVKLAIKPYYQKKDITKDEYKDILRKAVHKICHSKSGEINPVKVSNLVRAYVQRYRYFRKHGRKPGDPSGPSRQSKEPAPPDKCGPVLPVPPL